MGRGGGGVMKYTQSTLGATELYQAQVNGMVMRWMNVCDRGWGKEAALVHIC